MSSNTETNTNSTTTSTRNQDEDFVTKITKHRKKCQQFSSSIVPTRKVSCKFSTTTDETSLVITSSSSTTTTASNISLRPRTMFAMKGRGRTESEGSAYRPQWSKDGEGFVSSAVGTLTSTGASLAGKDTVATSGGMTSEEPRNERRKNKVLRYSKEEILALHVLTTEVPTFPAEITVISAQGLPPVSTLPFDYEEAYKQWSLNRTRGRGRGRGGNAGSSSGGAQGSRGHQQRGEEVEMQTKQQRDEQHRHNDKESTWERGAKVTDGSLVWDDVLEPGVESNEMDLSSMAEAAEKFRREMDAMREELEGPKIDPDKIKDDLDAFDKKLEDAAAAGQFDNSDNEEALWDDPLPEDQHNDNNVSGSLEEDLATLEGQANTSHQLEALEPVDAPLVLEDKSSILLSILPANEGFAGLSSLRQEIEDEWFYLDPHGLQQGPFKTAEMREWFEAGYFKPHLPIRFGQEGVFTALANQFVHGQIPFAAMPTRVGGIGGVHVDSCQSEQQRLLELQHEQQQQQQRIMQLQQQQQQMLRLNEEEKVRMEMQHLEAARQQQQTHLYQQQQMLQHQQEQQRQQQQQMLLQQQSSWQRSQREDILNALGMFGRNQDSITPAPNDSFRTDTMQTQFRSEYHTQHQMSMQYSQPLASGAMFSKTDVPTIGQALWPNAAPEMIGLDNVSSLQSGLQASQPITSPTASEISQPVAPKSPVRAAVPDSWGARLDSSERLPETMYDIQNEEKRRAVNETHNNDQLMMTQHEQMKNATPVKCSKKEIKSAGDNLKKKSSPVTKNENHVENMKRDTHAWATKMSPVASTKVKLLKDIQEEQRELLSKKMSDDKNNTANLAQMGAQLKMMLGVNSVAVTANTSSASAPLAPGTKLKSAPTSSLPSHTSVSSPWGTPAVVAKSNNSKSMRDILAEEERLAQERARANENAPISSHWVNVVAGNKVAAAAIPKPSRSVLGPVPASVLKSRQQLRATNGAPKSLPEKTERDASFWNFGAVQSTGKEPTSHRGKANKSNAFGLSNVSSEFMGWALKQLKTIDSNANVTLLEYCASVEDPGEVREYLAAYLGSTPRVSAFATEFIHRKQTQQNGKKSSPVHQETQQRASEMGSLTKRGKRQSKGQQIDPSLVNY